MAIELPYHNEQNNNIVYKGENGQIHRIERHFRTLEQNGGKKEPYGCKDFLCKLIEK